jgi:type II secretory pathway predicted ATPase ExeA
MYKNHFGLERRIFRGNAAGADVFVGPQTASILGGIKKAMAGPDAVVTLTGPVGSGKSTAVAHALGAISGKNAIVRVGRFPLQRGELLDLLFDHMRIQQRPQRGNQKLALFRQLLFNLAENESRMFILVEDAPFLGPDMLAELEVVTASDTGPSDGAAVVLMGDEYLKELLASKSLARLRQRIRLRRNLEPCTTEELGGYLRHCFRQAGGDFDTIFAGGALELLHELSGGIPRVVNNLVESSMEAAAEKKVDTVGLELVTRIADEEFGLTGAFARLPEISSKRPDPKHSDDATAELVALSMPEPEPTMSPAATTEARPAATPAAPSKVEDHDIPELIQDTQPALAILNDLPPAQPAAKKPVDHTLPDIAALSAELDAATAAPEPAPAPKPLAKSDHAASPAAKAQAAPVQRPEQKAKASPEPKRQPEPVQKTPPKAANPPAPQPKLEAKSEPRPAPKPEPKLEAKPELKSEPKAMPKPEPEPKLKLELEPEPKLEAKPEPKSEPKAMPKPEPEPKLKLELEAEPAADATIPTLSDATGTVATEIARSANEEIPDWDRDPTLAELRPDLDALERAMAVAQGRDPEARDEASPMPEPEKKAPPKEEIEDIPEITLDDSINRKVDQAALERKKRLEEEGIVEPEPEEKAANDTEQQAREERSAAELEKIAKGLAKAKTIEDVDDKMAETLFGEELSVAAAAVAARVAEEAAAAAAAASEAPAAESPAAPQAPARTAMEKEFENVWGETPGVEVSIDSETGDPQGGLDISASQRLATVRALNTGNPDAAPQNDSGTPAAPAAKPDPIEEQITTSLTQTMKALKVNPDPAAINDDDDDEDERKGGFFSRFRRS